MRELPIPRIVVNPWQFLTRSILTPAHRLAVCVDEYAVRLSLLHERFLVATISLDQFCARISLVFRLRVPPVTVHTPTRIRSRRWKSRHVPLESCFVEYSGSRGTVITEFAFLRFRPITISSVSLVLLMCLGKESGSERRLPL